MRNPRLIPRFLSIFTLSLLFLSPALVFSQGETYTDCPTWEAAVCGTVVGDDFASFVDNNGDPVQNGFFGGIPTPQTLVWGEVSQDGNLPAAVAVFVHDGDDAVVFDNSSPIVMTPNGVLGPLEGVCFGYRTIGQGNEEGVVVNFYDGDTLVASATAPVGPLDDEGEPQLAFFGWRNTDGVNVTRFEFAVENPEDTGFVGDAQLAFGDGCDPPEETCFEGMSAVKADIEALLATSTGNDACYLAGALDCVCWMQSDCFWEQPSGNRLSQYGGSMFIGAAYTVCYLEWVDDPQSDVIIDDLLNVLECIVDNEIAYAIANGGNQCYIDRAEDFADLGEIIDEDFDNQVVATLAYRLAWLHAYYSTY